MARKMKVLVGTSGWLYDWNLKRNFDWYLENSGLDAVELNASFYRFPFPSQIKGWAHKGASLRWAIKVNRLITHVFKFSDRAVSTWRKFERLFKPMNKLIDFYLFQLPPQFTPKVVRTLEEFIKATGLKKRFALEVRNITWFKPEWIRWARKLGITWVSVDCPDFPLDIYNTSGLVYERMHGRTAWYSHHYTTEELKDVARRILDAKPQRAYIFTNNQGSMLINAQQMKDVFAGIIRKA
jgi:uncharacterized protein YecE (DUF72 family)